MKNIKPDLSALNHLLVVVVVFSFLFVSKVSAQDIPMHVSYTRVYDFLDELANDGFIELNSAVKPYSRSFIAGKLLEAQQHTLNSRQRKELSFFLNELALETDRLPESHVRLLQTNKASAALVQPAYHYRDELFRARVTPLLGMHITRNQNGNIIKRWYGAEFQGMIGKNFSVYGSLRDISIQGDLLSRSGYLNNLPGYEYKESEAGGDFSDSRGGIKYANKWISFGLVKDNPVWGDSYQCANIISGRAPSFPMITLNVKPADWFELNYFHGWLVSNVLDSTHYYVDNLDNLHYRNANKFVASNMFTFTPIRNLKLSVGNAIVYAENNVHPAYFIPVAFYKSIDHSLTKGLAIENQNSQVFFNVSSRNIKHFHLYTSVFVDEVDFKRFKPGNPEQNPISYKIGMNVSNWMIENLAFTTEYTRSGIITYKHSVPALTWESNSYNLGHYMGDNADELYVALQYKPVRGLDLHLSYTDARKGRDFEYIRRGTYNGMTGRVTQIISEPVLDEIIWSNQTLGFKAVYEIMNNAYAIVQLENNHVQAFEPLSTVSFGENRLSVQQSMDKFSPSFLQGKNTTITVGFSFGF